MRKYAFLIFITILSYLHSDVAPNPIFVNGIINSDSTKIQMLSEVVIADVFKDSAHVDCKFLLKNHSEKTKISCGFPVMSFYYFNEFLLFKDWKPEDENFEVWINGERTTNFQQFIPDSIQKQIERQNYVDSLFMSFRQITIDSLILIYPDLWENYEYQEILDEALDKAPFNNERLKLDKELSYVIGHGLSSDSVIPWYLWDIEIDSLETIKVRVKYKVPSGLGYGGSFRFFKYIIHTGSGWYLNIENVDIIVKLNDVDMKTIEELSPENSIIDSLNKTITWKFTNLEPTIDDDIYVRYFDPVERDEYEEYARKKERRRRWYFLNYINPIYWIKKIYWFVIYL
jgi:hypothetical protein